MERKELIENLWQEADNDKRAIIVLATELTGTEVINEVEEEEKK